MFEAVIDSFSREEEKVPLIDLHAWRLGCERVAITRNCAILNSFVKGLTESILNSFLQLFLQNCDSLTPDSFGKGAY